MRTRLLPLLLAFPLLAFGRAEPGKKEKPPLPPVIDPGTAGGGDVPGAAPSDAIVLFDGRSLDAWKSDAGDKPAPWKLVPGYAMEVAGGGIRTKASYGYGHYHVEFRTPPEVKGGGQGRGNSGIFPMGLLEVQVLDSFENDTYPDGQCGAIYGRYAPLVNASRRPGVWQTFDILFHPPVLDEARKVVRKGALTVLHNGVVIHEIADVGTANPDQKGPLALQDHGNPVQYRNIWFRPSRPLFKKEKPAKP